MHVQKYFLCILFSCVVLALIGGIGQADRKAAAGHPPYQMSQTAFDRLRKTAISMHVGVAGRAKKENAAGDAEYRIARHAYVNNGIMINYPQVAEMGDYAKQERINELIKKEALFLLAGYSEEQLSRLTLEVKCEIKVQKSEICSIVYSGYLYLQGSAHPLHVFYTTNIDMRDGSRLRIQDIFNINGNFIVKIINGRYFLASRTIPMKRIKPAVMELLEALDTADWKGYPQNKHGTYTYFTSDSLGVSIQVPHPYGDHVEIEVPYSAIANHVKAEKKLWESL